VQPAAAQGVLAACRHPNCEKAGAAADSGGRVVTIADFGAVERRPGHLGRWRPGAASRAIAELLAASRLQRPITGTYPLERIGEAYAESQSGYVSGKLVLLP
jgi:hypothetical protein